MQPTTLIGDQHDARLAREERASPRGTRRVGFASSASANAGSHYLTGAGSSSTTL
jgi:hypothetical protein